MAPEKAVSPALKALYYAERDLGVNMVYEQAVASRNTLDELLNKLSEKRDNKRLAESQLEDKMMETAMIERGRHAEMSEAGMTRHLKTAYAVDKDIKEWRQAILFLTNDIEGLEYDKAILETDIKIAIARMTEMGGYLQYLAVIKATAVIGVIPVTTS